MALIQVKSGVLQQIPCYFKHFSWKEALRNEKSSSRELATRYGQGWLDDPNIQHTNFAPTGANQQHPQVLAGGKEDPLNVEQKKKKKKKPNSMPNSGSSLMPVDPVGA